MRLLRSVQEVCENGVMTIPVLPGSYHSRISLSRREREWQGRELRQTNRPENSGNVFDDSFTRFHDGDEMETSHEYPKKEIVEIAPMGST